MGTERLFTVAFRDCGCSRCGFSRGVFAVKFYFGISPKGHRSTAALVQTHYDPVCSHGGIHHRRDLFCFCCVLYGLRMPNRHMVYQETEGTGFAGLSAVVYTLGATHPRAVFVAGGIAHGHHSGRSKTFAVIPKAKD